MIFHLVGSSSDMSQDYPFLKAIIESLNELHVDLVRNWVDTANGRMTDRNEPYTESDWESIMSENASALTTADAVIVEATHNRFSQGYQLAMALQLGKPVLLLDRAGLAQSFSGLSHKLLTRKSYTTEEDIRRLVKDFVQKNNIESSMLRLDYKMTPEVYRYVEELSAKSGKSEEQVLNELVSQYSRVYQ